MHRATNLIHRSFLSRKRLHIRRRLRTSIWTLPGQLPLLPPSRKQTRRLRTCEQQPFQNQLQPASLNSLSIIRPYVFRSTKGGRSWTITTSSPIDRLYTSPLLFFTLPLRGNTWSPFGVRKGTGLHITKGRSSSCGSKGMQLLQSRYVAKQCLAIDGINQSSSISKRIMRRSSPKMTTRDGVGGLETDL